MNNMNNENNHTRERIITKNGKVIEPLLTIPFLVLSSSSSLTSLKFIEKIPFIGDMVKEQTEEFKKLFIYVAIFIGIMIVLLVLMGGGLLIAKQFKKPQISVPSLGTSSLPSIYA